MNPKRPAPEQYLAFPKAISALHDRLSATEREIACWLFFDQIKAYGHVHEFPEPPGLSLMGIALTDLAHADRDAPPYVNALEGAFFLISDIDNFEPPTRYISLDDLVQRWLPFRKSRSATISFIRSRIIQSRLLDFAPGLGQTELSSVICPYLPAEWAMFDLAEIEAIETTDFPDAAVCLSTESTSTPSVNANNTRAVIAPDSWEDIARLIGIKWMEEQKELAKNSQNLDWMNAKAKSCPGVNAIAQYVEGELSNRNITGKRGKYLDMNTIKRQALTGITGRYRTGKNN